MNGTARWFGALIVYAACVVCLVAVVCAVVLVSLTVGAFAAAILALVVLANPWTWWL